MKITSLVVRLFEDNSNWLCVDYICECITWACIYAGRMALPLYGKRKQISLLNEVVENAKAMSLWWHQIWRDNDRPTVDVVVYDKMKAMRANLPCVYSVIEPQQ